MSTWIYERLRACRRIAGLLFVPAMLLLAGCLGPEVGVLGFLASGKARTEGDVPRKVVLYDGDVVLRAPEGYCFDRRTMRQKARAGFVLVASCEAVSGLRGQAVEPMLITVSVLPDVPTDGVPTPAEMARSLAPAEVLVAETSDGLTLAQLSAGGDRILPGGDARHWRGGMVVNGHLIGLALYARKDSTLAGAKGRKLVIEMARRIRRASPDHPTAAAASSERSTAEPVKTTLQGAGDARVGKDCFRIPGNAMERPGRE